MVPVSRWLLCLLALLMLAACQGQASPVPPSPSPIAQVEPSATLVPVPSPTVAVQAEASPTVAAPVPTELPVGAEVQPNGWLLTREVERADLTGDGREEEIVRLAWMEAGMDAPRVLELEVLSPEGENLYATRTWTEGFDPRTNDSAMFSLYAYDVLESVEVRDLTGVGVPQVIVQQRRSGTGQYLVLRVLSFTEGEARSLFEGELYKGSLSFDEGAFRLSQALYLYGEPNCCACRMEHTIYGWDGVRFVGVERERTDENADPALCPPFPQQAAWQALEATNAPPPRRDAALVHDVSRNRVLLFGGRQGGVALDDTWSLDLATLVWMPLGEGEGARPPARFSMVAGLDSSGDRLLVTTGQATNGSVFNDLWALNLATDSWEELTVTGEAPPARYGAAGGLHWGGEQRQLYLTHGFATTRFNDTWVLDVQSLSWQNVTPGGTTPLNRCLHGAALRGGGSLVLFGGCSSGFGPCPQGDTWQFDPVIGGWELMSPEAGPPARQFPQLVTLADRDELLLFGGLGAGDVGLNDTWLLDPLRSEWRKLEPAGTQPPARDGHSLVSAYRVDADPATLDGTVVLLFGGTQAGAESNDLWLLTVGDE